MQVARILTSEKVECPSYYLAKWGLGTCRGSCDMSRPYTWTAATISDMVKKPEYMGHTVNFRTHKDSYKDRHSRKVNPEDWILFENTQEPIVDEDTWHIVQKIRETKHKPSKRGEPNQIGRCKNVTIREYRPSDCKYLAELFYQTIHSINAKDYTDEQLNVWATGNVDINEWNLSLSEHFSPVAIKGGIIAGFGDIDRTGYLDRLYVHKDYQSQGIATAICDKLEHAFGVSKITTHASITAKPFFLHRGYNTIKEQQVIRSNIPLTNYIMEKPL